jgi:hypothetical protein
MPDNGREHGFTCREVVDLAADFVEGALPPEESALFEVHLNYCDGCISFVDQIRTSASLAGRIGEEDVPDELKDKLLAAFRDWKGE